MKLHPKDAAKITNKSVGFVMASLQKGVCPFGYAVEMPGGRYSYFISEHLLRQYVGDEAVDLYIEEEEKRRFAG